MLLITRFLIVLVPAHTVSALQTPRIAIDHTLTISGSWDSVVSPGDLNGDGVPDLALGSRLVSALRGIVWIRFMAPDGTVLGIQVIDPAHGGPVLDAGDAFGTSAAPLGDLDGDGMPELAVGAPGDDDGGSARGAVWILFLRADGTAKSAKKISQLSGGFTGNLVDLGSFGVALALLGDLDGDGLPELAVGAHGDPGGGSERGAVWVLFLKSDGTVLRHRKISGSLATEHSYFGRAVSGLGDLDWDGIPDMAVGARLQDAGGWNRGAVHVVFLAANGSQRARVEISSKRAGFGRGLNDGDRFGSALQTLGDLDMDGTLEIAVGADGNDSGRLFGHLLPSGRGRITEDRGGVWVLSLLPDGTVARKLKWSSNILPLVEGQEFGSELGSAGDLDGNGLPELVVGSDTPSSPTMLFLVLAP